MKKGVLSLIISALLLGGCTKDFPPRSFSTEDQEFMTLLEKQGDYDSRLLLARMHFLHNHIDKADTLLEQLVAEDPNHPEAQAWYGANNCKQAARAFPWLLGLRKLYLVNACLEQVTAAADKAPDDFTVQLVQINTGAEVAMFGSLKQAREAKTRLERAIAAHPEAYPLDAQSHFYLAAAKVERASGNPDAVRAYLEKVVAFDTNPTLVIEAQGLLATPY